MAFLLSLFFGICVFATVLMMFQHYGFVREEPRAARPEPTLGARPASSSFSAKPKKEGFSLFGAIAGFFASLRGKKDESKETAVQPQGTPLLVVKPNTAPPVNVQPGAPQPKEGLSVAVPLAAAGAAAVGLAAAAETKKPELSAAEAKQPEPSVAEAKKPEPSVSEAKQAEPSAAEAKKTETSAAVTAKPAPAKDETEAKPVSASSRFCPQCGAEISGDAAFCGQCGEKFAAPASAAGTGTDIPAPPAQEPLEAAPAPTSGSGAAAKPDEPAVLTKGESYEAAKDVSVKTAEAASEPSAFLGAALPAAAVAVAAAAGLAASAAKKPEPTEPAESAAAETRSAVESGTEEKAPVLDTKVVPESVVPETAAPAAPDMAPLAKDAAAPLMTITTLRGSRLAIKPCDADANFVPYPFERIYTQPARLSSFTVLYFLQANGCPDSVIEVGIAPVEEGKLKKATSFFVRPPYNDFNSRKTRLSLDDVKNSPTFAELWPEIEGYISENVVAVYDATVHLSCLFASLANYSVERPSFVAFDIKETVKALQGGDEEPSDLMALAKKGEMPLDKDNSKECAEFAAQIQLLALGDNPRLENRMMLFADRETIMEQLADGALAPESAESESRRLLAEIEGKSLAESASALTAVEGALLYEPNAKLAEQCAAFHERFGDAEGAATLRELAATKEPMDALLARVQSLPARLEQLAEKKS